MCVYIYNSMINKIITVLWEKMGALSRIWLTKVPKYPQEFKEVSWIQLSKSNSYSWAFDLYSALPILSYNLKASLDATEKSALSLLRRKKLLPSQKFNNRRRKHSTKILVEFGDVFIRRSCHVICAFSPKETDQHKQHFTYFNHKRILGGLERWLSC